MPLLEVRHAGYVVGDKKILDDLDMSIREGEIHALIGTNGIGKSTLARLIIGIEDYKLSSGQIHFAGKTSADDLYTNAHQKNDKITYSVCPIPRLIYITIFAVDTNIPSGQEYGCEWPIRYHAAGNCRSILKFPC
jgi:ABC-type branched-subunit amino acid transport system ATPase component